MSPPERVCVISCLFAAAGAVSTTHAQVYPERTVRILVPFPPGGSTDIVGRVISTALAERLKVPVVVENRAGAGGNIGSHVVASARPDGYTLLVGTVGTLTINPSLYKEMPYNVFDDLAPIAHVGSAPNILVVHPSLPARSVKELIALARSKPRALNYASAGSGGSVHLAAELFKSSARVELTHVPYKGSGPALVDLISGHTQLMFATMPPALPHVKSGRLRALGTTGAARSPITPAVPTIAEAGLPKYEVTQWWGLLGPRGLNNEVVSRLNSEVNAILEQPNVRLRFAAEGAETVPQTPRWFASLMRQEFAKWAEIVRHSGAKVD